MRANQQIYYIFLLISLVGLVFYGGFLFGNRERVNVQSDTILSTNPNGQETNSISKINLRPIIGSANATNVAEFGKLFFLVNENQQTEILINLENVPARITAPSGASVEIPATFRVDLARRIRDDSGRDTYEYQNISQNEENPATMTLIEDGKGTRTGQFSGFIEEEILIGASTTSSNIERIVLRPVNEEIQNIFIDPDQTLPLLIRGNAQANIPGQPAPFFWTKF